MNTVTVCFNDTPAQEVEKLDGTIMAVPWTALLDTIGNSVRLRPDEIILGLLANDTDIRVKISRKKGRKKKQ